MKKFIGLAIVVLGIYFVINFVLGNPQPYHVDNTPKETSKAHEPYEPPVSETPVSSGRVPESLAGVPLTNLEEGEQAIKSVTRLHMLDHLEITDAYIATYQNTNSKIIVWVSYNENAEEAAVLMDRMNEKMPNAPAFTDFKSFEKNGMTIYYAYWPNAKMDNYWYQIDERLYWIAATSDVAENSLTEALDSM